MNKLWKTTQNQHQVKVLPVHSHVHNHYLFNIRTCRGTAS